jgi:predicted NAD-dependent protein-ADP-ribosyltransferase YbiA (DUF1768 family)
MIKILNRKTDDCEGAIYCGRGSPLGNPFDFTGSKHPQVKYQVKSREEAISSYSHYLAKEILEGNPLVCDAIRDLQMKHFKGEDIYLSCYCAPLPCHLEVIKEKIEESKYLTNWFSNMRRMDKPLKYQGINFHTAENFYQAMKTHDIEERKQIAQMNPYQAKVYARKIAIREDWDEIKLKVMEFVLKFKFAPDTIWHKRLVSYNKEVVEWNNWQDVFWGVDYKTGKGANHLGKIIETLR